MNDDLNNMIAKWQTAAQLLASITDQLSANDLANLGQAALVISQTQPLIQEGIDFVNSLGQ